MIYFNVENSLPAPYTEVIVWIDGKRNPMWSNNYPLVAYINYRGEWLQERYPDSPPLEGVFKWAYIEKDSFTGVNDA